MNNSQIIANIETQYGVKCNIIANGRYRFYLADASFLDIYPSMYIRRTKIVHALLTTGADADIQDASGKTALMIAKLWNYPEVIDMLENINLYKLRKKPNIDNNKTLKNSNIF